MQCPNDGTTLVMSERHGVEIDYCPRCRGVWLDRGELDKIIDRGNQLVSETPPQRPAPSQYQSYPPQDHYYEKPYKKHKRESFLSDLFDF